MKLNDILAAREPLKRLSEKRFASYKKMRELVRLRKAVEQEFEFYSVEEKKAVANYAEQDKNGAPIFLDDGRLRLKDYASKQAFEKEIAALRETEVDGIERIALSESDFRTFKPDVLSKHRIKNEGQVPMYYAEGTHPAIIDKELFELAKAEMARRKGAKTEAVGSSKFTSKYTFSGMLICGKCGSKLRRHTRRVGSGKVVPAFGCSNRIVNGRSECDSHHINEDVIARTYLAAIRTMAEDADEIIEAITEGAEMALQPENAAALERIETEIIELQQAVLELHKAKQRMEISETEYASRMQGCKNHMILLEKQQTELRAVDNRFAEIRAWLNTFAEHTKNAQTTATLDAIVIKALVDHITMYDEHMEITFKCGASIEQKYEK